MAALRTSPPHVYDMECMCRWVSLADGGPFPEGSWADTRDAEARPAPDARSAVCVEVSDSTRNRERAYIARAALDGQEQPVFGIWEDRQGTDWVIPWLQANRDKYAAIVLRTGSGTPALSLLDEIEAAGLPLEKWSSADVSAGHGQMFDHGHVVTQQAFGTWIREQQRFFAPVTKQLPKYSRTYTPEPLRRGD